MVLFILILLFIILICYQIFLAFLHDSKIVEGMTDAESTITVKYVPTDQTNASALEQQNAGNIQVLKQQLDSLLGLDQQVKDISGNVILLQQQVNDLVQAQQNYATQMTPSTTPDISGVEDTTTSDVTQTS